jgi:O-acetylserine/cysteine efflux transporter
MLMSLLLEYGQAASLATADGRGWLALAYTIFIGGIVGFGLWFWLIARCSIGRVAPFGLLLPVFALMSSVLFLGDRVTPKLIAGGLLAISGVAMTQVRPVFAQPRPACRSRASQVRWRAPRRERPGPENTAEESGSGQTSNDRER